MGPEVILRNMEEIIMVAKDIEWPGLSFTNMYYFVGSLYKITLCLFVCSSYLTITLFLCLSVCLFDWRTPQTKKMFQKNNFSPNYAKVKRNSFVLFEEGGG